MPDDRDGDDNVVYFPQIKNIDVPLAGGGRPAGRPKPRPARRWRPAVILAAVAFVAAMLVATGSLDGLLVMAAIAGVIVLGAALTRKRPARQRELRRPRTMTRQAPGDSLLELHVWVEFWATEDEPTMIEAVEAVLQNLYEDQERRDWTG